MENTNKESFFQEKESKTGPVIGSIIVILIILVGGLFFLSKQIDERKIEITNEKSQFEQETVNDISSLDQEIDALNLGEVDKELDKINQEFDSI